MNRVCVAAAALVILLTGCAQAGDILGGVLGNTQPVEGGNGSLVAEVRRLDERNGVLDVRTEGGQDVRVRFDQNLQVVYRQQQYPPSALEPGDVVEMSVTRSGNDYYTRQIDVRESVQDRGGASGGVDSERLYQTSGTVGQIDTSRGAFIVRTGAGKDLTVALPYNPSSSARDRFNRLRRGDAVRVEGRLLTQDRMELTRFF